MVHEVRDRGASVLFFYVAFTSWSKGGCSNSTQQEGDDHSLRARTIQMSTLGYTVELGSASMCSDRNSITV